MSDGWYRSVFVALKVVFFPFFHVCIVPVLNLTNCPVLRTPPKEIREQGMKTVIAYLKRLSQGSQAVYQTKLMVVGLGGVGKTRSVFTYWAADAIA